MGSTSGIRVCALRNFNLEVTELENTQNNALAKLHMLKLGEFVGTYSCYSTFRSRIMLYGSTKTKPIIQEVTPTEVIQDQGSSKKGSAEVSTAGATKGTASEVLVVSIVEVNISTAEGTVTYRRRSEEKRTRKDKGKAIMTEPEPKKKSKKELEQESLCFAEAIRLEEQDDHENKGHRFKGQEKYDHNTWKNQGTTRLSLEKIEEKYADIQKEVKEVAKESGAKRKKSLPRKRRIVKRQKLEEDAEKEELKGFLDIIPREEFAEDVESLSTKGIRWQFQELKVFSEMLKVFDRQDVEELYRLVKESHTYADREEIPSKSRDDFQDVEKEIGEVEGCLKESSAKEEA
ncbi:hypothetical protein Tco_0175615 [Tanacetum coccineum]